MSSSSYVISSPTCSRTRWTFQSCPRFYVRCDSRWRREESLFYEKNLTQGGRGRKLTFGSDSDWISLLISFCLRFGGKGFLWWCFVEAREYQEGVFAMFW